MLFGAILFLRCERLKQRVLIHPNYSIFVLIKKGKLAEKNAFQIGCEWKEEDRSEAGD